MSSSNPDTFRSDEVFRGFVSANPDSNSNDEERKIPATPGSIPAGVFKFGDNAIANSDDEKSWKQKRIHFVHEIIPDSNEERKFPTTTGSLSTGSIQAPSTPPKEGCSNCKALNGLFTQALSAESAQEVFVVPKEQEVVVDAAYLRKLGEEHKRKADSELEAFFNDVVAPLLVISAKEGLDHAVARFPVNVLNRFGAGKQTEDPKRVQRDTDRAQLNAVRLCQWIVENKKIFYDSVELTQDRMHVQMNFSW